MALNETQTKKLDKILKLVKKGPLATMEHLLEIEERIEEALKTVDEKIKELEKNSPNASFMDVLSQFKGKDGDTPDDERLLSLILPNIPAPIKGDNYVLTVEDKKQIAKGIKVPVVKQIVEKVEVVREQPIVTTEVREVAKYRTAQEERDSLETLKGDERLDSSAIKGLGKRFEKLSEEILNRAVGILDNRTSYLLNRVTNLANSISSSPSGGGFTELTATGTVNSINITFTFTDVPTYIVADGIMLKNLGNNGDVQWSNVGTTITMVNPPSYSIYGIK